MPDDPELRRLLWFLLGGKRGGENRARIIQLTQDSAEKPESARKGAQHSVQSSAASHSRADD